MTTQITWVLGRLPSGPTIGSPVPKSTWASNPGGLSIRRNGTGGAGQAGGFSRCAGWHLFYFSDYQIVATG